MNKFRPNRRAVPELFGGYPIRCLALALLAAGSGTAAVAAPVRYECAYSFNNSRGWIADKAAYLVDTKAGSATVLDANTKTMLHGPAAAKLKMRGNNKLTMKWALNGVLLPNQPRVRTQDYKITYSASLDIDRNKITVRATANADTSVPGPTTMNFSAKGNCARTPARK